MRFNSRRSWWRPYHRGCASDESTQRFSFDFQPFGQFVRRRAAAQNPKCRNQRDHLSPAFFSSIFQILGTKKAPTRGRRKGGENSGALFSKFFNFLLRERPRQASTTLLHEIKGREHVVRRSLLVSDDVARNADRPCEFDARLARCFS